MNRRLDSDPFASEPPAIAAYDRADSVWNRAAAATPQADPFCCRTEWQLSFHEAFPPQRPLVVRERAGSVLALALSRHTRLGPVLEPIESHWSFGSPLLGEGAVDLLAELLDELARTARLPCVAISGVWPGDPRREALAAALERFGDVVRLAPETLCHASLDGGFDGFLARRSGHMRRNLRQAERRAAARGITFERCVPRDVAAAHRVYARMLRIERRSWKGFGRCGMAEQPSRRFYAAMLRRLAPAGDARVVFARAGDLDVGFVFGGMAGEVYRGQQFSYCEGHRDLSIGSLLQLEQLRWLAEDGAVRYDLGPLMDYKPRWAEGRTAIQTWLLRPVN